MELIHIVSSINLWNPNHVVGIGAILITALLLGFVHGITPDEHTWPITFSYAIGSYSTRKGLKAGLIFSLAFTIQRAIASELAYLGLSRIYTFGPLDNVVYVVVGLVMYAAGVVIVRRKSILHFDLPFLKSHKASEKSDTEVWLQDPRPWMPAVHGFIAGWGFGAFAIIIYTVLAPNMGSAYLGWVPGAVFGLGTMLMQVLAGGLFGLIASRNGLNQSEIRKIALKTAGNTLTWGGIAFIAGGVFGLIFPNLASFSINTGIQIHNLDSINIGLILVMISVVGVGLSTLIYETRKAVRRVRVKIN